jgi:hypothetical protein
MPQRHQGPGEPLSCPKGINQKNSSHSAQCIQDYARHDVRRGAIADRDVMRGNGGMLDIFTAK